MSPTAEGDEKQRDEIELAELLPWLEFCCWVTLGLTPILYWVNGPSVSADQFVVRTTLVIVAAVGAVTLRIWHCTRGRRRGRGRGQTAGDTKAAGN